MQMVTAFKSAGGGGLALPTFVANGSLGFGTGAITPGLPTGWAQNDILVLIIETNNQAITVSGYTEAGSSPASNAGTNPTRLTVFWKRAGASETAPTTSDSGDHQVGRMAAYRGCVTTGDPFDVTNSDSGGVGTAISIVGATTTWNNSLVLAAVASTDNVSASRFSGWANSDLSSVTERIDNGRNDGAGGTIGLADGGKAVAGAYGTTSVTQVNSVEYATWTGALKGA
jgi:hypothetical protein